ncbi:CDP-diacylglycerol diphosphatase, partial [Salmonella enterica subsp. enterica serovar Irumu]|nr:CDP-diacylglycerol diphosphatase [Salmonella enterica subsp. enterica serovar Irumu]
MKKTGYFLLAVIVIVAAAGVGYWKFSGNPDALREIV